MRHLVAAACSKSIDPGQLLRSCYITQRVPPIRSKQRRSLIGTWEGDWTGCIDMITVCQVQLASTVEEPKNTKATLHQEVADGRGGQLEGL